MGMFCIMVELNQGGSASNEATPSSLWVIKKVLFGLLIHIGC